ncbi:MAG: aminomethyl transferase family protein [Myxococcales bacterium]|nr:aminomethyl transferase family protein [Myxococcales bacterium]
MSKRISVLEDTMLALGAEMGEWNGMDVAFTLPSDPRDEHTAIREAAGLWDTSVLKKIHVRGTDALAAVDYLVSRDMNKIQIGRAGYSPVLKENGHFCDDGYFFRISEDELLAVTSIGPSLELLQSWSKGKNVSVELDEEMHIITIQGPKSVDILETKTPMKLRELRFCFHEQTTLLGKDVMLSRTGYSGERGYEIFVHARDTVELWKQLLEHGAPMGLMPISWAGLEKVHIESALMAYGAEATEENTPWEVDFGWSVSRSKGDFRGREALFALEGKERVKLRGIVADHDTEVDHGADLMRDGERVGHVTTPAFSERLGQSLALVHLVPSAAIPGTKIQVVGPKVRCDATVTRIPFVDPERVRLRAL